MKSSLVLIVLIFLQPFLLLGSENYQKPNVIIILADDLGYGDLSCYGAKDIRTPNLDQMAKEGLRLTDFYAQPICGPSRAALMTGSYPIRIGEVKNGKNGHTLPHTKEITLPELLQENGYFTSIIGKWHLGMSSGCDPLSQGFNQGYFTPSFNGTSREINPKSAFHFLRKPGEIVRIIKTQADMDTITSDCTREAIEFLYEYKTKAFFLYLAYHMPHVPLGVSAKFRGKSSRGLYGDVVEELDDNIGQILFHLKKLHLDQNTLVIFTSDNGPWNDIQIGDHGGSPGPFRGGKMMTWEGGWRVPCIIRWPGHVASNRVSNDIAATIDFLPTIINITNSKLPDIKLDGLDLSEFIMSHAAKSPRNTFYFHNGPRLTAIRHNQWKLIFPVPAGGEMEWQPNFVTNHIQQVEDLLLYDLSRDSGEQNNIAAQNPSVVEKIQQIAKENRSQLGDYQGPGTENRFFEDAPHWPQSMIKMK